MKRIISHIIVITFLVLQIPVSASSNSVVDLQAFKSVQVDKIMDDAMARGLIAGGVVLVGSGRGVLFEKAYGRVSPEPSGRPMTIDTLFDIASLTKVVATTPAILKLAEERRLSLVDPVRKWFPEFGQRDDLLIMHLLTHTSGLDDFSLNPANPLQSAISGAANQKVKGVLGSRFHYADINFILLGEIVRKASGLSLDQYAYQSFFAPLGMRDTLFTPDRDRLFRCSATVGGENNLLVGQVQDYLARQLGGVAGHAGLFSTADDLARFCMMMFNQGELSGKKVLSNRAIEQMTAPYFSRHGAIVRGLGWDIASPYSAPRGNGFSEGSFGHTGYSGSSLWLDPDADIFVVLLTSRIDYRRIRELSKLRGDLSTIVAAQLAPQRALAELLKSVTVEN